MRLFISILIVAFVLPTSVYATDAASLMPLAPSEARLLLGADMSKVRGTMVFDEVFKFLKENARKDTALHFVLNTKSFDFNKDVDSVLLASKAASFNPNGAKPGESMVIVSGTFHAPDVITDAQKAFKSTMTKKEGFDVLQLKGFELAAIDKNTLILAENKFAASSWSNAKTKKKSVSTVGEMKKLIKLTDLSRGVWAVASSASLPKNSGPKMDGSSISASLKSGVAMTVLTAMTNDKDAKQAVIDLKKAVADQGSMATVFGAKPLVDNLKVTSAKKNVKLTTSMSNGELRGMMKILKTMNTSNLPTGTTAKNPQPIPKAPASKEKGAEADFN